jgi:hypothetical protein
MIFGTYIVYESGDDHVPSWESDSFSFSCYLSMSCLLLTRYRVTQNLTQ